MATRKITPLKKTKPALLEIRQKKGSKGVMVGANTELLIDGKPVRGAKAVTFSVDARGVAEAVITVIGRFVVSGKVRAKQIKLYK